MLPWFADPNKPAFGPDAVHAFKAFQKAFIAEGKEVKYLQSGEMGGFNTFTPMLVAILSDKDPAKRIKMVDVDCNGRAVPELKLYFDMDRAHVFDIETEENVLYRKGC